MLMSQKAINAHLTPYISTCCGPSFGTLGCRTEVTGTKVVQCLGTMRCTALLPPVLGMILLQTRARIHIAS